MNRYTTWDDLSYPGLATDFFARRRVGAFDPLTRAWSEANAVWLMELSRLVYRHDVEEDPSPPMPQRSSYLASNGFRQRAFFQDAGTGTVAFLVESTTTPTFAVLAFRGTEVNIKDYVTDLKVGKPPLDSSDVVVHEGFKLALDSVWDAVAAELAKLTCPVFFTGHSLGAALATLAAARHAPAAVYTFGSPYVGDKEFVESLVGVPVFRCKDDIDIVTVVPPEEWGFRHVGELHHFLKPKRPFSFNPADWWAWIKEPPRFLADHTPINYTDRIGNEA